MKKLKKQLKALLLIALSKTDKKCFRNTAACYMEGEFVLQWEQDGCFLRRIGYWSRALNFAKRQYDSAHQKCSVVVWTVLLFHPYIKKVDLSSGQTIEHRNRLRT